MNKKLLTVINENINKNNVDDYDWNIVTHVEGRIYLFGVDHKFIAPNLTTVTGDIDLWGYEHKFVTTNLVMSGDICLRDYKHEFIVPNLTHTGVIDLIGYKRDFIANNLTHIRSIDLWSYEHKFIANNLTTSGDIDLRGYKRDFIANNLTHTGVIDLWSYEHNFVANNLTTSRDIYGNNFMGQKIEYFDHIPCIVKSRKTVGDFEIIKAKEAKVVDGKFGGDTMYIVKQRDAYAHGKTVKDATDALVYKQGSRDTAPYNSYTVDTIVSHKEAIHMYMAITGACAYGTRLFVEGNTHKKDAYSVQELIELTAGQYGHQTFKTFFTNKG